MKLQRQSQIRDLLSSGAVGSQDELRRRLAGRGFRVTQATLSRDMRELRLLKGPAGYALPVNGEQGSTGLPAMQEILSSFGLEVRQAKNLLVVLTSKGAASPVAAAIDDEEWTEVHGTIAGDNTVLVVCADTHGADAVRLRLEAHLG